jgi:hypothetical protein
MTAITLAEAKEKLGELIDRVAQGETVEITTRWSACRAAGATAVEKAADRLRDGSSEF